MGDGDVDFCLRIEMGDKPEYCFFSFSPLLVVVLFALNCTWVRSVSSSGAIYGNFDLFNFYTEVDLSLLAPSLIDFNTLVYAVSLAGDGSREG